MSKKKFRINRYYKFLIILLLILISISWIYILIDLKYNLLSPIATSNKINIQLNSIFIWNANKYCTKHAISKYQMEYIKVHGLYDTGTNALFSLLFQNCYGLKLSFDVFKHINYSYYTHIRNETLTNKNKNMTYFKTVSWGKYKHDMIKSQNNLHSKDNKTIEEYIHSLHVILIKDPLTWFKSICKMSYGIYFLRHNWNWKNRNIECLKSFYSTHFNNTNSILLFHKNVFLSIIDLWNAYYSSWLNAPFTINEQGNYLYNLYGVETTKQLIELFNRNDSFILKNYQNPMRYIPQSDVPHVVIRFEDLLFFPDIIGSKLCECVGGVWNKEFVVLNYSSKTHGKSRNRSEALKVYGNKMYRYDKYTQTALEFFKTRLNQTILNMFNYQI
eukprot:218957_1